MAMETTAATMKTATLMAATGRTHPSRNRPDMARAGAGRKRSRAVRSCSATLSQTDHTPSGIRKESRVSATSTHASGHGMGRRWLTRA
jgi:hypothetical protein